jgi:hypothetical protein
VLVEGTGHLVAFEKVKDVGEAVVRFLGGEVERWEREKERFERRWSEKSRSERAQVDGVWKEKIGPPSGRGKEREQKL